MYRVYFFSQLFGGYIYSTPMKLKDAQELAKRTQGQIINY